jgi:hypothetical protein
MSNISKIIIPIFPSKEEGKQFMLTYPSPVHYGVEDIVYTSEGEIVELDPNTYEVIGFKMLIQPLFPEGNLTNWPGEVYIEETFLKYNIEINQE